MDFAQYINDNEQKLINDLNTIKSNLRDIFDFYEVRQRSSDSFTLKINGMDSIWGYIKNGQIHLSFSGVDKFAIKYDEKKTLENIKNKTKCLTTNVTKIAVAEYSQPIVNISFSSLTNSVVKDIMYLTNNTDVTLNPSHIGRF